MLPPSSAILALTSSVRATGEKTARLPEVSLTIVPRPPTLTVPNREKGTERVTMLGVTLRMTMTSAGFHGMSLEVMLADLVVVEVVLK